MKITDYFYNLLPKRNVINNVYYGSTKIYDGEKSTLEQGPAVETDFDYYSIRKRAMVQFLTNGNVSNLISKYKLWLVGTGLQVQMNPKEKVLKKKGIVINDKDEWTDYIDELFNLWSKSFDCSIDNRHNLHGIARQCVENGVFIAGDILSICRYDKKNGVTVELVDGDLVRTPPGAKDGIIDGVELDSSNKAIAFWVEVDDNKFRRIPARNKNGQEQAWLMYGLDGKLSSVRGLSKLAQSLDYTKKVSDFAEALIKAAKENANVYAVIKHGVNSDGGNPMSSLISTKETKKSVTCDSPSLLNEKINKTSEGAVLNMGPDQEFERYRSEAAHNDSASFHNSMNDLFYSNNDLPPEIARNQFGGSYSSSRMVGKTWETQFMTMRETLLVEQLYNKVFKFWFEIMVATGDIEAKGYFGLDNMGKDAYINKSFRGLTMPHVDPLKEINAARRTLGPLFDNVPLATLDDSIDKISNADSSQVLATSKKELEKTKDFKGEDPVEQE